MPRVMHFEIGADQPDRAAKFYADAFGWKIQKWEGPMDTTFCAELRGGYGFSRNWVNSRADYFFARTEEAGQAAQVPGNGAEKVVVSGHWAPPAFYDPAMEEDATRTYLRQRLGLESDRFTLLLSTGGNGAQNHAALLRTLRAVGADLQVIALCGRNEEGRTWLEKWAPKEVYFPVRVLPLYAGNAGTAEGVLGGGDKSRGDHRGEILLRGCPVVFNAMGGIMPQEMPTWRYFHGRKIGHENNARSAFLAVLPPMALKTTGHPLTGFGESAPAPATTAEQTLGRSPFPGVKGSSRTGKSTSFAAHFSSQVRPSSFLPQRAITWNIRSSRMVLRRSHQWKATMWTRSLSNTGSPAGMSSWLLHPSTDRKMPVAPNGPRPPPFHRPFPRIVPALSHFSVRRKNHRYWPSFR